MDAAKIKRAEEIFQVAVDLPTDQRGPVIGEYCAGDAELRTFVEQLLAHHETGMGEFLRQPAFTPVFDQAADIEPGHPTRIGHYEIVRVIGEGGMGVVYEARQENPHRTVALKVIRPGLASTHTLRRFQYEAEVLGRLQHPGIACIYEAGTAEVASAPGPTARHPFFAMEFVQGKPLSGCTADVSLAVRARLQLVAKICAAVQHAHQKGVIHRDLKPGNILVDASGQPKILDFGVARAIDPQMQMSTCETRAGQLVGTVPYMSPEQVAGDPNEIDTRSDVYALGVILYEMLSGKPPITWAASRLPKRPA